MLHENYCLGINPQIPCLDPPLNVITPPNVERSDRNAFNYNIINNLFHNGLTFLPVSCHGYPFLFSIISSIPRARYVTFDSDLSLLPKYVRRSTTTATHAWLLLITYATLFELWLIFIFSPEILMMPSIRKKSQAFATYGIKGSNYIFFWLALC